MKKKVHVTDITGNLLYTRLWDDGSLSLEFDSGSGFIDKLEAGRFHWKIKPGWKPTGTKQFQSDMEKNHFSPKGIHPIEFF